MADDDSNYGESENGNVAYRAQDDMSESGQDNVSVYKYMDNDDEINDDRRVSYYVNKQELGNDGNDIDVYGNESDEDGVTRQTSTGKNLNNRRITTSIF